MSEPKQYGWVQVEPGIRLYHPSPEVINHIRSLESLGELREYILTSLRQHRELEERMEDMKKEREAKKNQYTLFD